MSHSTSTKAIRAGIYLRQSLDREGNEIKVDTQRTDVAARFRSRGITSWVEYKDNDIGASGRMPGSRKVPKRRPGYEHMIEDIKANKLDLIGVADADRLYRHPRELEDIIDLADVHRLELVTVSGDFDLATPTGRGNARMKGVFSRMEMEQKAARQKRANVQRLEDEGGPWWPSRPFGFDADLDKETLKWWTVKRIKGQQPRFNEIRKHPTEAKLLKRAYSDFLAGSSLRSIATAWNKAGVKTPRGNAWTGSAVREVLMAARNAGLRQYGGEVAIGADGQPRKGTWPAIVTEEAYEMAVRKLKNPERRRTPDRGRKHLLSGLILCGREECGKPMGSTVSVRGTRQYVCIHCQRVSRDGQRVDDLIVDAVVRRLSAEDAVDLLRPPIDEVDAAALREERRNLKDRLTQLGRDFATADPAFTQAALADINGRLDVIREALEDPGRARIFEGVIGAKDVRKAFLGLDLGRRRTIVDALMVITINPVSRGSKVFDPNAIDVAWKEDL
jgi:DNA invertase Pin-like site-specific DNA recombinase